MNTRTARRGQPRRRSKRPIQPAPTEQDRHLDERIARFLRARQVPGSDAIRIESRGGTVLVSGPLPSEEARRLCLQCCRHVAGVLRVVDRTEIREPVPVGS